MNEVIRPLTEEDEQDVIEIGRQVWGGHDYVPSTFHDWLDDPDSHPQAIEANDQVVCFANLRIIDGGRTGWFEGLRTHPQWREQGLARTITEHLARLAEDFGVERIRYTTATTNEASLKLAHHIGMEERFRMSVTWFSLQEVEVGPSPDLKMVGPSQMIHTIREHPSLLPMSTIIIDWKAIEADEHGIGVLSQSNSFWLEHRGRPSLSLGKQRNEDDDVLWCFSIYALDDVDFCRHVKFHITHGMKNGYASAMITHQPEFSALFSTLIPEQTIDRTRGLVLLERVLRR